MVCIQGEDNMYFHANSKELHLIEYNVLLFAFIDTMTENMKGYSAGQIKDATRATDLITASMTMTPHTADYH